MVLFSKFGKTVKDLFKTDKYELNRTLSVKGTSGTMQWETEAGFPVETGEGSAKLVWKHKDEKFGAVELSIQNTKPNKLDYATPSLMEGLKVNLIAEQPKSARVGLLGVDIGANLSLKAELQQEQVAGKLTAAVGEKEKLTAEVAAQLRGVWVGGEVSVGGNGLWKYCAGVHYQLGDTEFDFNTDFEKCDLKVHKEYCSIGEVAAEYDYDTKEDKTTVKLGGKWILDEKSTTQGFLTSSGDTYLLYKHKVTDRLTASLGTSFDIRNFQNENINVHCKLEMKA